MSTKPQFQPQHAEALAKYLLTIRPDWSLHYCRDAVWAMRKINPDIEAITAAAVRGALTPKIAKPDVLAMGGEHWKPPAPAAKTTTLGANAAIRCATCHGLHTPDSPHDPAKPAAARIGDLRAALADGRLCRCDTQTRPHPRHEVEVRP